MRDWGRSMFAATLSGFLALTAMAGATAEKKWYRGNTHTHTLWSDGDGAPEAVTQWYKEHGYQFLVLSDHNVIAEAEKWFPVSDDKASRLTPERLAGLVERFGAEVDVREKDGKREMRLKRLEELRRRYEEEGRFLLIKGEEITDRFLEKPSSGTGKAVEHPIHHNSINHVNLIKPPGGGSVREVLERVVKAVEEEAAKCGRPVLVHLNHPNFGWGVSIEDLARVTGERYFEVYNGHRSVRNYGDAAHPGTEKIWDVVLAMRLGEMGGPPLFALATDDSHHYHKDQGISNPGRGWIVVRAESLAPDAIVRAMQAGDFYASSGVFLEDVVSDGHHLRVKVRSEPGVSYSTRFIGTRRGGEPGALLMESEAAESTYEFKGDELYVRATIVSSRLHPNGYSAGDLESAWVQPAVLKR
jgi:hypothetical protein